MAFSFSGAKSLNGGDEYQKRDIKIVTRTAALMVVPSPCSDQRNRDTTLNFRLAGYGRSSRHWRARRETNLLHLRMDLKMNFKKAKTPTALAVSTHGGHEAKKCIWRTLYSPKEGESTLLDEPLFRSPATTIRSPRRSHLEVSRHKRIGFGCPWLRSRNVHHSFNPSPINCKRRAVRPKLRPFTRRCRLFRRRRLKEQYGRAASDQCV